MIIRTGYALRQTQPKCMRNVAYELGFTLVELVTVICIIGILSVLITMRYSGTTVNNASDIDTIKTVLRQLQVQTMSDLPSAIWSANATATAIEIRNNGNVVSTYTLSGSTGAFSASFNQSGKPQVTQNIPSSITLDAVTGYIQ